MHRLSYVALIVLLAVLWSGFVFAGNEADPKGVDAKATFNCIGLKWYLGADDNKNATCTVEFRRKGTEEWRKGLDLFRVKFKWRDNGMNRNGRDVNAIAGSIFHLAPGTPYEVKLSLKDPDGGSADKTINITTHALPQDAKGGKVTNVKPGELKSAIASASPGDILMLEKGDHGGGIHVKKSGEEGKLIVIRGPEDMSAVVHGTIRIDGSYLWFDRFTVTCTVEGKDEGVNGFHGSGGSKEVFITRCKIIDTHYGCNVYGYKWFVTDNWILGDKPNVTGNERLEGGVEVKKALSGEGVDFHHNRNGVCVAAYNNISRTADGVSYGDNNIDVYNNECFPNSDDNIEPDYGYDNYRVWENKCWGGVAGISFQPFNGGPWYVFRNQFTGNGRHILKLKEGYGPQIFVNNTLVQPRAYKRYQILMEGILANNIWLQIPPGRIGRGSGTFPVKKMMIMDHNIYGTGGKSIWDFDKRYTLKMFQELKLETHSHIKTGEEVLAILPKEVKTGTGVPLLPKKGSVSIDGGTVITNLIETYAGKAPDIGAYELEFGPNWTGPRTFTKGGLGYGAPKGWEVVSPDKLKDYKDCGAPAKIDNIILLLARKEPAAFVAVSFEKMDTSKAWKRFEEILEGKGKDKGKIMRFLDSLAARICKDGDKALLFGAQVDPRGVWNVAGGCAVTDLEAVTPDLFSFVRSLQLTLAGP